MSEDDVARVDNPRAEVAGDARRSENPAAARGRRREREEIAERELLTVVVVVVVKERERREARVRVLGREREREWIAMVAQRERDGFRDISRD